MKIILIIIFNIYLFSHFSTSQRLEVPPRFLTKPNSILYLPEMLSTWHFTVTYEPIDCRLRFLFDSSTNNIAKLNIKHDNKISHFHDVESLDEIYIVNTSHTLPSGTVKFYDIQVNNWKVLRPMKLLFSLDCPFVGVYLSEPFIIMKPELGNIPLVVYHQQAFYKNNDIILEYFLPQCKPWPPKITFRRNKQPLLINNNNNNNQENRYKILLDDKFSYITKVKLIIQNARPSDAGFYDYVATNTVLNESKTSESTEVKVEEVKSMEDVHLRWRSHKEKIFLPIGASVTLTCSFQSNPPPKLKWIYKESKHVIKDPQFNSLYLTNVTVAESGNYTCIGSNVASQAFNIFSIEIKSVEEENEEIIDLSQEPQIYQSIVYDQQIHLEFNCQKQENKKYFWFCNGIPCQLSALFNNHIFIQDSQLSLRGNFDSLHGIYQSFYEKDTETIECAKILLISKISRINIDYSIVRINLSASLKELFLPFVLLNWEMMDLWTINNNDDKNVVNTIKKYYNFLYYRVKVSVKESSTIKWSSWKKYSSEINNSFYWLNDTNIIQPGQQYQFRMVLEPIQIKQPQVYFISSIYETVSLSHILSDKVIIDSINHLNISSVSVKWHLNNHNLPEGYSLQNYYLLIYEGERSWTDIWAGENTKQYFLSSINTNENEIVVKLRNNVDDDQLTTITNSYTIFMYAILMEKDSDILFYTTISDPVTTIQPKEISSKKAPISTEMTTNTEISKANSQHNHELYIILIIFLVIALLIMSFCFFYWMINRVCNQQDKNKKSNIPMESSNGKVFYDFLDPTQTIPQDHLHYQLHPLQHHPDSDNANNYETLSNIGNGHHPSSFQNGARSQYIPTRSPEFGLLISRAPSQTSYPTF